MNNKKQLRILIVDDEAELRDVIAQRFKIYKYDVITAASGNSAIAELKRQEFDIIITDIKMPDGSGVDILQFIRSRSWETPKLFFISGFSSVSVDDLYNLGADGLFSKPFDTKELLNTIRSATLDLKEKLSIPIADSVVQNQTYFNIDFEEKGSVIQLGRGGLFLKSEKFFPRENELVGFDITLKLGVKLSVICRVKWSRQQVQNNLPAGSGLEFVFADSVTIDWLNEWRRIHQPVAYIPLGS